ncbi:hypothetical protein F4775DRAFT_605010 [Biscogniauxia sp. FL1348]|nr:hypothetical protein F4775DRAFT_605010 [Biscogniauxia sp. FL1348]
MRFGSILIIAFAGMVVADDCFRDPYNKGTPKWDDERAQKVVEKLIIMKCEDGTFNGKYEGKQSRSKSYTITNLGNRWVHIEIEHVQGGERDLSDYDCKSGLVKELKCAYGGAIQYENWSYRAQPYDETMYEAPWYNEPRETITVNL